MVEQRCAGISLANRARREHTNGRWRDRVPGRARITTVDDTATRSNLVDVVIEPIGSHRNHLHHIASAQRVTSERKSEARSLSSQLENGIVWPEQRVARARHGADA